VEGHSNVAETYYNVNSDTIVSAVTSGAARRGPRGIAVGPPSYRAAVRVSEPRSQRFRYSLYSRSITNWLAWL